MEELLLSSENSEEAGTLEFLPFSLILDLVKFYIFWLSFSSTCYDFSSFKISFELDKLPGFRLCLKIFYGRISACIIGFTLEFDDLAFSTLKIGAMHVYLFPTFCFKGTVF